MNILKYNIINIFLKCIISKKNYLFTFRLNILCEVWNKDSNYLFDYESNEYSISSKTINTECFLMKNDNDVKFILKKNLNEQIENNSKIEENLSDLESVRFLDKIIMKRTNSSKIIPKLDFSFFSLYRNQISKIK